jgi:hypothetical protein
MWSQTFLLPKADRYDGCVDAQDKQNRTQSHNHLYLRIDVLLLADVFENFRRKLLQEYQLDSAHFNTLPGLSWQAALKWLVWN